MVTLAIPGVPTTQAAFGVKLSAALSRPSTSASSMGVMVTLVGIVS